MKRLILALAALTCSVPALAADNFPAMNGSPVIDQANILGPIQKATVDGELRRIYKETHHQVAVLTLKDMGGQDPADYGVKALRHYKLGSKERNDGVLLIVSMSNPRRLQIAVGYGLEGELTDAKSVEITESMKSYMRNGYPGTAILTGISGIEKQISKEVVTKQQVAASDARRAAEKNEGSVYLVIFFILLVVGGTIMFVVMIRRSNAEMQRIEDEFNERISKIPDPSWEDTVERARKFNESIQRTPQKAKPIPTTPVPKADWQLEIDREIEESNRRRDAWKNPPAPPTYSPPSPPPSYDDSWTRSSPPPPPSYDWGSSSSSGSSSSDSFSGDGGSGGGGGGGSDW